jgi:hypothetical protein
VSGPSPEDPRLRGLFQALPRRRAPGEECPEPAELWASARGEVDGERTRWLIGHTGRCMSCAEDWRLARHLERGERGVETILVAPSGTDRTGRLQRFALAATVILAVAVAALWAAQGWLEEEAPVPRSDPRGTIESLTPDERPLPREEPVLRWRGPEGVEDLRYDLTVTTERFDPVARADRLETTAYPLPAEAIADLPSGSVLLWRVEARSPDGSSVGYRTFRIRLE